MFSKVRKCNKLCEYLFFSLCFNLSSIGAELELHHPVQKRFDYQNVTTFSAFLEKSKPQKGDLVVLDVDNTLLVDGYHLRDTTIIPGLKQLVKDQIPVVILTARMHNPSFHRQLVNQLDLVDYSPFKEISPEKVLPFGEQGFSPVYQGCVLYVRHRNKFHKPGQSGKYVIESKGENLSKLLHMVNFMPKRMSFMDDKEKYLKEIHQTFSGEPIDVLLFRPPQRGLYNTPLDPLFEFSGASMSLGLVGASLTLLIIYFLSSLG